MGGMERPGAPEGTTVNEGAAPVGRRDFGLAEEIASVERAARDWGVHVDALEGQFVRALLKAIEETGKTNLAALGDLEALLERARREGEADRRRIERMIEAGSNALAMAHQATERAGLASIRAEEAIEESIARIAQGDVARASGGKPEMAGLEADGAQSARGVATGRMGRRRGCGGLHRRRRHDAMVECEGERGSSGRAGGGRPLLG